MDCIGGVRSMNFPEAVRRPGGIGIGDDSQVTDRADKDMEVGRLLACVGGILGNVEDF